jgi:hypothetical protein
MGWGMLWLFLALKIPLLTLCYLVWWAIKQEPEPVAGEDDGGNQRTRPHPVPKLPHAPRRGPHGDAALPSPPRVRPLNARAKQPTAR